MDLLPSADGVALARAVRELLHREGVAAHVRTTADAHVTAASRERMTLLAGVGVIGVTAPEPWGLGLGAIDAVAVGEELGATLLPEPLAAASVVAGLLLTSGPGAVALGEEILEGAKVAAFDPRAVGVVTDGLLSATIRTPEPLVPDVAIVGLEHGLAVVDIRETGLSVTVLTDPTRPIVTRTFDAARVLLQVELPAEPRRAARRLSSILACAEMVGALEATLGETVTYASTREQFNRPIGAFQSVQHQLADCWSMIEAARAAVRMAAAMTTTSAEQCDEHVDAATLSTIRAARHVTERCLHLHGGMGYAWETGIHLAVRRAAGLETLLGPVVDLNAQVFHALLV